MRPNVSLALAVAAIADTDNVLTRSDHEVVVHKYEIHDYSMENYVEPKPVRKIGERKIRVSKHKFPTLADVGEWPETTRAEKRRKARELKRAQP